MENLSIYETTSISNSELEVVYTPSSKVTKYTYQILEDGSIIQTYTANKRVEKGSEKGYFKFGGSTCIFFFEKGKVKIDEDIINQTKEGYETSVVLGEQVGKKAFSDNE